jgi:hypothetical protein
VKRGMNESYDFISKKRHTMKLEIFDLEVMEALEEYESPDDFF